MLQESPGDGGSVSRLSSFDFGEDAAPLLLLVGAEVSSLSRSAFRHFARRFWNQTCGEIDIGFKL